jgi:hypothetical protein
MHVYRKNMYILHIGRYSLGLRAGWPGSISSGSSRFSLYGVHTGTEPDLVACPVSTEAKRPDRETDHIRHLLSRSRVVQLYVHSPMHLYGVVLN